MTRFRPCIDLHDGKVKQIVGSSLQTRPNPNADSDTLVENFVSTQSAAYYAQLYAADQLVGGHLIKLGPGNDRAAMEALSAFPGGLQVGGGIDLDNATDWLDAGATHVIVTSWLFDDQGCLQHERLQKLVEKIGRNRLVIDLSCKKLGDQWRVMMNRWQTSTELTVDHATLDRLAGYCDEFLIHAADVEGLCQGIDTELVTRLGKWQKIPITYAGGISTMQDVRSIDRLSDGSVDFTVGSALDLFGGTGLQYNQLLAWNARC